MSWYHSAPLAPDLRDDLVTAWTMRAEGEHRLVPDACVDVLWIGNGTAWVCGPEVAAWTFSLPPGTFATGVRFRPGRAGAVLGFDATELRDRRVPLADVVGSRCARHLVEQADEAPAPVQVMQRYARTWLDAARPADPVVDAVAGVLGRRPATGVADLADIAGLGPRQLHRRCVAAFGYGPATLRRILRLQRFLRLARHPGAPVDLAHLAALAGYTDQPHLYRDSREIGGAPPRDLICST